MKTRTLTSSLFALAIAAIVMSAGMVHGYTITTVVNPTGVTGHDGGNWPSTLGHLTDMLNATNVGFLTGDHNPGIDTSADVSDPSTWINTAPGWQTEWLANSRLDATTSLNNKIGWAVVDFGSATADLGNMYIWSNRQNTGSDEDTRDFNLYYSSGTGIDGLPAMPDSKSTTGDYDFSSGDWTQIGTTRTLGGPTSPYTPDDIIALGGVSAQYIGIEILTAGNGTVIPDRIGLAQVEFTTAETAHAWNVDASGSWDDAGNWDEATFPNAVDAVADFNQLDITGDRNIAVNQAITIGSLILGDTVGTSQHYNFNVGTAGSLTFDVSSGNASMTKTSGEEDRFYLPVALNDTVDVNITAGNTISFEAAPAAIISGSGGITKTGAGQLQLGAGGTNPTHTYTGTLDIQEGLVMARDETNLGAGNINLSGGVLTYYWGATMYRSLGAGTNQIQFTGGTTGLAMNGNTGLTVNIAGTSELQWGSTYFKPDTLVLQDSTSQNNANLRWLDGIDLNGATRTIEVSTRETGGSNRAEMEGVIRDSTGSGAGLIKEGNSTLQLEAANTFTGGITINGGTVRTTNNSGLGNGGPITFNAAGTVLDLQAGAVTIGALSSTGAYGSITRTSGTGTVSLTVDQDTDTTYAGTISNGTSSALSLVKDGSGLLAITGDASYTGTTQVLDGTLIIDGDFSAATGQITVAAGGMLGGSGTLGGTVVFQSGGGIMLTPGETLTINGGTVNLGDLSLADLMVTGPLSLGVYTLLDGTATFDFTDVQNLGLENEGIVGGMRAYFQQGSLQLVVIPEPSTIILAGLGLLGVTFRRRRR